MIHSYLTIAFRQLLKNKRYLVINTLGMGIAIACAMTSYLLIAYNIEFDSTIDEDRVKNIVKVVHHRREANGDPFKELVAPISLGPVASQEVAGITRFSRFFSDGGYVSYDEKGFHETIFFADSAFLDMFLPELVSGSYKSFSENSIFLSEKYALKYFGDEDPIGKTMEVAINNKPMRVIVGGVLRKVPFNSTFAENLLMRAENYLSIYDLKDNDWATVHTASLLFELKDLTLANTIADQFKKYTAVHNTARPQVKSQRYELLPFLANLSPNDVRQSDLHLRIPFIALGIFMTLGGIVMLIACFNLTNTTLALSMRRLKEIGVRKVSGSTRFQIASQFFIEITLTVAIAVVAGFGMSLYIIPEFAAMWQLSFGVPELNRVNILITLMILLFCSALLAGVYPALFSSKQNPVVLFKGGRSPGGTNLFTRSLLVIQFSLSIVVLICGTVFTQNAAYQSTISFGYDKDKIITALIQGPQEAEALMDAITSNSKIEAVSPSVHHFAFINAYEKPATIDSHDLNVALYEVGENYFETIGLQLISGRTFNDSDTAGIASVVVDESFVKRNNLTQPLESKIIVGDKPMKIIGVVSDHLTDLESDNTENYAYTLARPDQYQILVVRAESSTLKETQQYIHTQWKKIFPGKPLRTDLQEDILYEQADIMNRNLSQIFLFMTVLGCLLSVSGLYSMASLNMHRRMKEISVRRVLGASMTNILKLVNTEFAIILVVAMLLGGAGGYALSNALLSDLFAQHIGVSVFVMVMCGIFVFIVGMTATSITIWNAASANPVEKLKSE
jgi:putative ABC transport system permease protein